MISLPSYVKHEKKNVYGRILFQNKVKKKLIVKLVILQNWIENDRRLHMF